MELSGVVGGETDLANLLKGMRPVLQDGVFVFACLGDGEEIALLPRLQPLAQFREVEGLTVVVARDRAEAAGLSTSGPMRQITLTVHSALEAVGLTAAFSAALTEAGISANVIAGFYHDHIFVPERDAERALAVLRGLSSATP